MQIEQAYVKFDNREKLIDSVKSILANENDVLDIDMETPNCFDLSLINDSKRKIGVSDLNGGWISILESSEFNDYTLLLTLSDKLGVTVVAVSYSDIIGGWGYAEFTGGTVSESFFSDEEDNEEIDFDGLYDSVNGKLADYGIDIPIYTFREIANTKKSGWVLLKK